MPDKAKKYFDIWRDYLNTYGDKLTCPFWEEQPKLLQNAWGHLAEEIERKKSGKEKNNE